MIIRNKKTGEIREVSMNELNQYGLGGQHNKLIKYQKKGEVKKTPSVVRTKKDLITNRENVSGDSFTGTMRREALAYLPYFKDAMRYLEKGISYVSPDYKSQADRELIFKRHRPVAYPTIADAGIDLLKDYSHSLFNTSMKKPFIDPEGDYEASEEAWRMSLGLPVKSKYIIPSKYRPLNEENKTSKYYTLREDMYNKDLLRQKIKELKLKPGQSVFLPSFAPFVNESYMNQKEFSDVDPLQNFKIGVNKNGKMYFYDKYDFDFEPLSKVTRPYEYEFYNELKTGGEMIKRADGSYSRRGLWDNIRANAGSGKRPTKEMLNQERKIRNQHQAEYGMEVMGNGGLIKYKEKGEVKKTKSASVVKKPVYEYKPQNLVAPSFNNLGQTTYSEITPIDVKKAKEDYKNKVIKAEAYVNKQNAKAIEFHKKWMSSPMYKKMLYKSDPINAETIEKNRWVNFNNINSNFNPIQKENWGAVSNGITGNIQIYPIAVQNDVPGIGPHEFSHSIDSPKGFWNLLIGNRNIPNTDENKMYSYSGVSNFSVKPNAQKEWIYKNDPRFYKYVAEPTETRARLNEIRNSAYENNLYDPFTQKVDANRFNKLLKFEKNQIFSPLWELQHVYTDDQIIDLLNTVSKNDSAPINTINPINTVDANTNSLLMKHGGQHNVNAGIKYKFNNGGDIDMYGMQYQDGGDIPTIEGPSGYMNEDNVWVVDNETITKQAQELGAKKVLTEGGSLIIFDDNWNIVAADDNPDAPYKQGGSVTLNTGGENHRIYVKTTNRGEGEKGHIMVNHPTMDKGMWDTIDLTQKSGATTIAQGVAATKKWHRENPYMKEYGGDVPMYGPGGFVAKPTASDSLAVMNFQIALNKFYDNEVKKRKLVKSKPERFSNFSEAKYLNDDNLDFYRTQIKNREERKKSGNPQTGTWDDSYKSNFNLNPSDVSKLEYQGLGKTKSGDSHKKYYRDLITPMQNLAAPFALVDTRIKPQHVLYYAPTDINYPGGAVSVYDYDPIVVKPAAMKTAADWAYVKKMYGTNPPVITTPKPTTTKTVNTTKDKVTTSVRPKYNLERIEVPRYTLDNPKVVPHGELFPIPQMTLPQQGTIPFYGPGNTIIGYTDNNRQFYPLQYSGAKNNQVNLQDKELLANPELLKKYVQSKDNYKFAEGGGIPERYRNMGFTNVGAKRQSTRPGKKWMVLAKKGDDYKVVHGGYKGMQDFKQHHSEQRKENFWSRMGGRNSSKATDPFSPLYWHKRFGTWEYGGQPMAVGGQNVMNPIVKKDNRNWLEYLKN